MGSFYERVVRPTLFMLDPERAHEMVGLILRSVGSFRPLCSALERAMRVEGESGAVQLFGLRFPNQLGLAAGFDKNATMWPALLALGFGHVEVGTVTLQGQAGNPRPRVFRVPADEGLVNRMGFNNDGVELVASRLRRVGGRGARRVPLGVNIGKLRATPLESAAEEYVQCFPAVAGVADYVVVNVSSPNTPGLRGLQREPRLRTLLQALVDANALRASETGLPPVPILVKISPDMDIHALDRVLQVVADLGIDGVIATNTTTGRKGIAGVSEEGGLSGRPLREVSTAVIKHVWSRTEGKLPIIGVGGIFDADSAAEKLDAGASLVQIYTGMIYRGPLIVREILKGLSTRATRAYVV